MANATPVRKVALLGADGNLGPAILHALLEHNFTVTVLKRSSSKSPDTYPEGVTVTKVPDDFNVTSVAESLQGQDAVVVAIKGSQTDLQARIAEAAIQAGVRRFIPADFGSADSSSQWARDLVPLFEKKADLREHLTQLSKQHENFTWTSLVCGHFFDWSLEFLHMYLPSSESSGQQPRADILDKGDVRCSASTLSRIGEATARVLLNPAETANRMIYVQSFCATQMEVVRAFERVMGVEFKLDVLDSKRYADEEKAKADGGDLEAVENLVWLLGTLDADWTRKRNFAMETLGLEDEDLEVVVRRVVEENRK